MTVAAMALTAYFFPHQQNEPDFLEGSVFEVLKSISAAGKPEPPSLSIENVTLEKVSAPVRNSNYHKYNALVFVKNNGGRFRNAVFTLSGDGSQKDAILKNSPEGLSLRNGETYVLDDYEILFDGNYNGGVVTLEIDGHDTYELEFFELPPRLEGIKIRSFDSMGKIQIDYSSSNFFVNTDEHQIYMSDSLEVPQKDKRYSELFTREGIYGYHVIRASEDLIKHDSWKPVDSINIDKNPFENKDNYFFFVKATNPNTGHYGVSNIIKLGPQNEMTRGDFAKLFFDAAGVEMFDDGEIIFEDVSTRDWFAPYVQTLFNLGLLDYTENKYFPEEKVTRGDVLITVMDYFDVNLAVNPGRSRFDDVPLGNFVYHYTQALFESGKAGAFGDYFGHDLPATRSFMTHIIHAYK